MSKRQIIKITSFKNAIPQKDVWYSYYDDIFVSVIRIDGGKSHLRNKSSDISKRKDNIMSEWHTNWQYNQIESFYGKVVGKEKTYEVPIYHNGEKHIIDSVVGVVAIEFQHTLSVSVTELDLRWKAHVESGYTPYLVLDFTEYSIPHFFQKGIICSSNSIKQLIARNCKNENDLKVMNKLKKWTCSEHFINGNLFLEFKDRIIRFHKELIIGFIMLDRTSFVKDILSLETKLYNQIQADILARKKKIEENRQKELELERLEEERRIQNIKQQAIDEKERLRSNNIAKKSHRDYGYFRKILNHTEVEKNLSQFDFYKPIIQYEFLQDPCSISHIYFCKDLNLILEYRSIFKLDNNGNAFNSEPDEIKIIRRLGNETKTFTYGTSPSKVKEKRVELAKGYLHSLEDAALFEYDENGKLKGKSYYIHNEKIDDDLFKHANKLYDEYAFVHVPSNDLTKEQSNRLQDFITKIDDEYHFQRNIISNYGIYEDCLENYYKKNEIIFQSELMREFYISDF